MCILMVKQVKEMREILANKMLSFLNVTFGTL
jgi:hypothetical protein